MNGALEQKIEALVRQFFEAGNVQAQISVVSTGSDAYAVACDIADEAGQFIGHGGETLDAFEHLVRLMANRITDVPLKISVDVNNYKERRAMVVRERARAAADAVRLYKTAQQLEPMSAYERRIVHLELAGRGDVITESMGEGSDRRVVIKPAL